MPSSSEADCDNHIQGSSGVFGIHYLFFMKYSVQSQNEKTNFSVFGLKVAFLCLFLFLPTLVHAADVCTNKASLVAVPIYVPAGGGMGKTRMIWQAPENCKVHLYELKEDGSLVEISKGNSGDFENDFILPNRNYEYRLYAVDDLTTPLAAVKIIATPEISYFSDFHVIYDKLIYRWSLPISAIVLFFIGIVYLHRRQKSPRIKQYLISGAMILAMAWAIGIVALSKAQPLDSQPKPDAQETADAALQLFNGNGYVTYFHNNESKPPRYPPGFSVGLAPFLNFGEYPDGILMGTKFYAVFYLIATIFAAWALGGRIAATLASIFIGISPFAETYAGLVMSEAFTAGMVVLIVILLKDPSAWRAAIAGAVVGVLVLTRLQMIVCLPALLLALPSLRLRLQALLSSLPFFLTNAIYNYKSFGGMLKTGYEYWLPTVKPFAFEFAIRPYAQGDGPWIIGDWLRGLTMRWICPCGPGGPLVELPNIIFYPLVLIGVFWLFAPPFITFYGLWNSWTHRRETVAKFTLSLTAMSLVLFLFYFWQSSRFVAPVATLLTIYAAIGISKYLNQYMTEVKTTTFESGIIPLANEGGEISATE